MATSTATTPVSTNDILATVVKAATTDISALWKNITGLVASLGAGSISAVLAYSLGDKTMLMAGAVVAMVASIMSIIAHGYTIFTGANANNSATIVMFENDINAIQKLLGATPTVWNNAPDFTTTVQTSTGN